MESSTMGTHENITAVLLSATPFINTCGQREACLHIQPCLLCAPWRVWLLSAELLFWHIAGACAVFGVLRLAARGIRPPINTLETNFLFIGLEWIT